MHEIAGLKPPIYALSPMDGISDTAFRQIVKKYGHPDLLFTEFVNVMGLCIAGDKILGMLHYEEVERPIVAQLFGKEPEYFYHAAKVVCALGFDGVDINMGCPAKNVAGRGAGASLIQIPELALEIIRQTKKGVEDWVKDGELTVLKPKVLRAVQEKVTSYGLRVMSETRDKRLETGITPPSRQWRDTSPLSKGRKAIEQTEIAGRDLDQRPCLAGRQATTNDAQSKPQHATRSPSTGQQNLIGEERSAIPVSVKTRIGYDKPVTKWWIQKLSEANPDWISIHGRTLKQMYGGKADWDELKIAVESTEIPVLVNGDVKSYEDIEKILKHTGATGVLIGRGALGNPYIFRDMRLETRITPPSRHWRDTSSLSKRRKDIEQSEMLGGDLNQQPCLAGRQATTNNYSTHYSLLTANLLSIMLEHAELFTRYNPDPKDFVRMRKHFGWYVKGFDGAKELRERLMRCKDYDEFQEIIAEKANDAQVC